MFLLEDGNAAGDRRPLDKPRKSDSLIAVLFSAAVIFYVILSLLSAHSAATTSLSGSQTVQPDSAVVGTAISTSR
jgi:hypothetical protein